MDIWTYVYRGCYLGKNTKLSRTIHSYLFTIIKPFLKDHQEFLSFTADLVNLDVLHMFYIYLTYNFPYFPVTSLICVLNNFVYFTGRSAWHSINSLGYQLNFLSHYQNQESNCTWLKEEKVLCMLSLKGQCYLDPEKEVGYIGCAIAKRLNFIEVVCYSL